LEDKIKSLLFDIISDYVDEGIAVIDKSGILTYYNKQMAEIEGLVAEEVVGRYVLDIYPTFNLQNSTLLKTLKTGKPILNSEQHYINYKGKKIFAIVSDIPIIEDGEIVGVIELAKDLYKTKNLYETINRMQNQDDRNNKRDQKMRINYYTFDDFKTRDESLLKLINKTKKLSVSDSNVLIYGETGTGKEIFAQSIHNSSRRKHKPFIAQNCAAIPESLLESILFGTAKGSFTGAFDRPGLFEQADGGTLLLDELNSMPYFLQGKLLRVLEEGYIRRVGASEDRKVNVRVIATVNSNPITLIKNGILRKDLFYRLSVINIFIPPLRERKGDILWLADYFISKYKPLSMNKTPKLSKEVRQAFLRYRWDGNVRELENVIESAVNVLGEEDTEINFEHLPFYLIERLRDIDVSEAGSSGIFTSLKEAVEGFEKELINDALSKSGGNITRAAEILKVKRQTLQHKMRRLNLKKEYFD
jgi:arginine utilization regulatory protein